MLEDKIFIINYLNVLIIKKDGSIKEQYKSMFYQDKVKSFNV